MSSLVRLLLLPILLALLPAPCLGHEPGLSHVRIERRTDGMRALLRFDAGDWDRLARAGVPDAGVRLLAGERPLAPLRPADVSRDGGHVDVTLDYPAPRADALHFTFTGFEGLRLGHRQYVELRDADGRRIADAVLQQSAPAVWLERQGTSPRTFH